LYAKNAVPKASFYAAGSNVQIVGNSVSFTSTSSDSDGTIVDWSWDFGDGNTAGTEMAENSYSNSGLYTVDLTVTDDDGSIDTITTTMVIVGAMSDDNAEDDPDNHTWNTVQEAINDNDVQDGDIVYVYNGSYYEGITVNKSVSLFGEDKGQVTIQSMGTVVDIISDSMCMDGFTVAGGNTDVLINGADNCTITNCIVSDSFNGIKINSGSDNNTISQCNFTNNSYGVFISGSYNWIGSQSMEQLWDNCYFNLNTYGIYIDNSNDNMIVGCNINATPDPSSLGITYGICLDDSENNTIIFCNVSKASNGYGIYLDDSNQNYICHNLIFENDHGVFLSSSSDNRVAMNNISNNDISGVFIIMMSSSNNSVHWNDFIRNGHGIYPQAFDDGSGNHWNTSGNETLNYISAGEGNYWSDYNGVDNDGDGIGDTPYSIAGTANAVDSYPVMKANEFFE
jgi:parallel beta-helix repeat protein